jgi:hypothetical protein
MKNIRELEVQLGNMFDALMKDPKRVIQAKEIANLGGKIINAQKISLEYASMHDKKQVLPFMERESNAKLKG